MNPTHAAMRAARKSALYLAEPLDHAVRLLNGKHGYPPVALRRQNGPLNTFERVAGEYIAYLVTLAELAPNDHVVDVGCGSGAMPIMLRERLSAAGRYTGFDVDRPSVNWCQRNLSDAHYRFIHHDYWNATYNRKGTRFLPWPVEDRSADVVLLKSIFTHMVPEDVAFYLAEIARVLRLGHKALATAFLYQSEAEAVAGRHSFTYQGEGFRYVAAASPESAIALHASRFHEAVADAGLKADILPGLWREDPSVRPFAYQDMAILTQA